MIKVMINKEKERQVAAAEYMRRTSAIICTVMTAKSKFKALLNKKYDKKQEFNE